MVKKIFILIIILVVMSFSLYGCYSPTSIENFAYVIALGIDKGSENLLKLTLQFSVPSDSSSGDSSQNDSSSITSVECASIDSGISLINSYISKQVNLSHCQVIVFSEEIASIGIENYIDTFMNNIEIRPDSNILISRCDASEFIGSIKPTLTNLTSKYYEVLLNSEDYTGYTTTTPIWKVSTASHNNLIQPVAILAGINTKAGTERGKENVSLLDKSSKYKADELPITNENKAEVMGLAVFDGNKLVGELDAMESICYLILTNELRSCTITIPSPFSQYESIDLIIKINNTNKSKVKLVNYTPFISCNVELRATIQSYSTKSDYSSSKNIQKVEEYAESYMKQQIENFLYKTSKALNSDIVGFGYQTTLQYNNINDWLDSNWYSNYKNSFFDVDVNLEIKTSSLFLKH